MRPSFQRAQSFILVWPGDDEVQPQYNGEAVLIPATDEIAVAEKGRYRFGSATDRAGKPIPGTVLVADIVRDDPQTAGTIKAFDAREWCEGLYANQKALVERGFRIVMEPEEVEAAKTEGRPLWERSEILNAENVIREELSRMQWWEKKGQPAPESSSHAAVMKAKTFLANVRRQRKEAFSKNDLLEALGEAPASGAPTPPAPLAPTPDPEADEGEADLGKVVKALRKAASDHGVNLTKAELEGLLDQDIQVMAAVETKLEKAGALTTA